MIVVLKRKTYNSLCQENIYLNLKLAEAEAKARTLKNITDSDRQTIKDLQKRCETQQRIIDKLNTGQMKPNPNKSATLAGLNAKKEDHDPYPEE